MQIGIISDTHDQLPRTLTAVRMLVDAGAEALFHCGDYTEPDIVEACGALPGYYVFGNNDYASPTMRRAMADAKGTCLEWAGEVTLAGKRIALTHGHLYKDVRGLLAARPDYLFSGHSHMTADELAGPTRRINPGALYRAERYTVAVLDLKTDKLTYLEVPR
jgi:putative phosphoesterase